jgi:hypothetical protein
VFTASHRFRHTLFVWTGLLAISTGASAATGPDAAFLKKTCQPCHGPATKSGGLDLTALGFDLKSPQVFAEWVKVHDRVRDGEMPPKGVPRPDTTASHTFLESLATPLIAADRARTAAAGRAPWRRLNRYEYENTLRDLLQAPWLQIKETLPEDGEAYRFNKVGDALDVSHVLMARYLSAADYALRQVMATETERPETRTIRYYAREQRTFAGKVRALNQPPDRAAFAMLGKQAQPEVRTGAKPMTVGASDPKLRDLEAAGVVCSSYEPIELRFEKFIAPAAGHYKLRFSAFSVWVGPGKTQRWWAADFDNISEGHRDEPVTIYSETPPRQLRRLGAFDATPEPTVRELDVWLLKGESIRPDAARLYRSRPPGPYHNPLATQEGQPGVAFRWMEVEGPIYDQWPTAGHRLLFADLPLGENKSGVNEPVSDNPAKDADRLLRAFLHRAYRRPVAEDDVQRFLSVIQRAMTSGSSFTDAMLTGYSAVLCSPAFIGLEEKPGRLDGLALAERLAYFLWNSEPDAKLRSLGASGALLKPETLRAQTERMLGDAKSQRFIDAFLDYWLDLRRVNTTSPDEALYPDYYLDDLLVESANDETQLFFTELLRGDLPARNIVSSDFAMLNERLAAHYGLPPVKGVALRRVALPAGSPRGGLMTQASVLKVTANGTTTSPVLRGAWVMERILGKPLPPPPSGVSAIEADTRGATTIREQLAKHRSQASCATCHSKIDPPGFALESFDVMGGYRERYRALGEGEHEKGYGKNGQPFAFALVQPVDPSGELAGGARFHDIREFKGLLLQDERQIARNLTQQLVVYATGAPVRFGDRPQVELILDRAKPSQYGVRSLIREIVQSELFRSK